MENLIVESVLVLSRCSDSELCEQYPPVVNPLNDQETYDLSTVGFSRQAIVVYFLYILDNGAIPRVDVLL